MAYETEVELLTQFAADLARLQEMDRGEPPRDANERANVMQSLHRRTAAMRRAVERTGVNFRIDGTGGQFAVAVAGPVDVLEHWTGRYIRTATIGVLQRAIGAYESGALPAPTAAAPVRSDPFDRVRRILDRIPRAARVLRDRYNGRETLKMEDEYDVQDLLRALLVVEFEDVRKEEWTPSYAGKCARMDLLLKAEQVVVEVKITKPGRTEKQIGDELIVDIERYQAHPDCKSLVCFVFDPTFQIGNPAALEEDLAREVPIRVNVIVAPKH